MEQLLTAAQVAKVLQHTPWTVTELCRSGELRASKSGKSWRIAPADLQAYLDKRSNEQRVADSEDGAA